MYGVLLAAAMVIAGALAVGTGPAGATEGNADPAAQVAGPEAEALAQLTLARQLAELGVRQSDPLALIVAARLSKELGVRDDPRQRESADGEADEAAKSETTIPTTPEEMLALARTLARGRQDVVALADEVGRISSRGRVGGPGLSYDRVRARGTDVYRVTFRGGRPAIVYANGDGDTDLDMYIYDENGNLICADERYGDDMYCSWVPRWTGNFRVQIRNHGRISNRYVLSTN